MPFDFLTILLTNLYIKFEIYFEISILLNKNCTLLSIYIPMFNIC